MSGHAATRLVIEMERFIMPKLDAQRRARDARHGTGA
jgi:hypothetical protein